MPTLHTDVPGRTEPRIDRPVLLMHWANLVWVHWPYDPDTVAARLPDGLEPDLHDGRAWVGLVPFDMRDIRLPGMPRGIPWAGTFPETNIRTYVRGPDGGAGVYFHSLDITRSAAVAVARTVYRLPYFQASMAIDAVGGTVTYRARRRWPGPRGVHSRLTVQVGAPIRHPTPLDDFLTARYRLYADGPGGLVAADIAHDDWPLREAAVVDLDDGFLGAAGYPAPVDAPHVRASRGVDVRVGPPRRLR